MTGTSSGLRRGAAAILALATACRNAPPVATGEPSKPTAVSPTAAASAEPSAHPATDATSRTAWIPERWDGPDGPLWGGKGVDHLVLTRGGALQWSDLRVFDVRTGVEDEFLDRRWPSYPSQREFIFLDGVLFLHPDGALSLVDAVTRAQRWSVQLARGDGLSPAPRYLPQALWQWAFVDGHLVALDAERWRKQAHGALRARAFDVATGARVWEVPIADSDHDAHLAGACEGAFLVGVTPSVDKPGALVAFDAATGAERWRRESAVAYVEGYLRSECSAGRVLAVTATQVGVLDVRTGQELWSRALGERVVGATLTDDAVYVGHLHGQRGELAALAAADGHELWRTPPVASRFVRAAPIASRRRVFWLDDHTLRAFDRATGAPRWTYANSSGRVATTSLVRDRGELLIFDGLGFDPDHDLGPREVTLSGTVRVASGAQLPAGTSLEGLELIVGDAQARTDARGRFTLVVRGRGVESIFLSPFAWRDRNDALLRSLAPPGRRACLNDWHDGDGVDLERAARPRTLTPVLQLSFCKPYDE